MRNLLADATPTGALVPASGYSFDALADGIMSEPFRTGGANATSRTLEFEWPATIQPDVVSVHDLHSVTPGVQVTVVELQRRLSSGVWFSVADITLDRRGDGAWEHIGPIVVSSDAWRLVVTLDGLGQIRLGEIWFGAWENVATIARFTRRTTHHVIRNGDFGRVIEPARRAWDVEWPPLGAADSDALLDLLADLDGSARTALVRPDPGASDLVLGWFGAELSDRVEPHRWHMGIGTTFTEGRRAHG